MPLALTPVLLSGALVLLTLLVAAREYTSQFERLSAAQRALADDEFDQLRKTLANVESLARYAVAVYVPGDPRDPDALQDLSSRLLPLVSEVFSMVWAPSLQADELPDVLARIGRTEPVAPNVRTPTVPLTPEEPRFLNLDIHPRTEANLMSRGLILNGLALPALAIREAIERRTVQATGPINLVQLPGVPALVIYGPVIGRGGKVVGILGFSYRFDALFTQPRTAGLSITASDRAAPAFGPVFASGTVDKPRAFVRDVAFAGRTYTVQASFSENASSAALRHAVLVLVLGLAGASIVGAVAYRLALSNRRLQESLAAEREADERLKIALREMAHRIGNVLGLVQSIARQTFTSSRDPRESMSLFEGRLSALAHSSRLATGQAIEASALSEVAVEVLKGFAGKVRIEGTPVTLGPISGQFMMLVLHELATNAAKYGALNSPEGEIDLTWSMHDDAFEFIWREQGGKTATLPNRKGFGTRLLTELVPAQLGGFARREMDANGLRYTLTVPGAGLAR